MKVERQSASPPQVQEPNRIPNDSLQPQPIRTMTSKSKSIFTPIDAGSSLAASWGFASNRDESKSQETTPKKPNSPETKHKSNSLAGRPQFVGLERADSMSSIGGGSKRPRLILEIPSEQSDDETGPVATTSSPHQSGDTATSAIQSKGSELHNSHSGMILPPPSPSTLLSASASGPPNPFARPLPPSATNQSNNAAAYAANNTIETPMSALPSRFLTEGMLPSPSSFYPEWGFSRSGGGDGNILPSPLAVPTPIQGLGAGSGFGAGSREGIAGGNGGEGGEVGAGDRKRKTPDGELTPSGGIPGPASGDMLGQRAGKKIKAES